MCYNKNKRTKVGEDMQGSAKPVDVISVCSADGTIRPLRLRIEDESNQLRRIDIEEIVKVDDITYVGVEGHVFYCRATVCGQPWLFRLRYTFRSHTWRMLGRIH